MTDAGDQQPWLSLWQRVEGLGTYAEALRRLSQQEPLLQARPDYPQAPGIRVSHADDLRRTLDGIRSALIELRSGLPDALPNGTHSASGIPEEAPAAVEKRLETLTKLTDNLLVEAFQPLPPLPKHAPPYVLESPRHDLAGSKAVYLSYALEEIVASVHNALLSRANAAAGG